MAKIHTHTLIDTDSQTCERSVGQCPNSITLAQTATNRRLSSGLVMMMIMCAHTKKSHTRTHVALVERNRRILVSLRFVQPTDIAHVMANILVSVSLPSPLPSRSPTAQRSARVPQHTHTRNNIHTTHIIQYTHIRWSLRRNNNGGHNRARDMHARTYTHARTLSNKKYTHAKGGPFRVRTCAFVHLQHCGAFSLDRLD